MSCAPSPILCLISPRYATLDGFRSIIPGPSSSVLPPTSAEQPWGRSASPCTELSRFDFLNVDKYMVNPTTPSPTTAALIVDISVVHSENSLALSELCCYFIKMACNGRKHRNVRMKKSERAVLIRVYSPKKQPHICQAMSPPAPGLGLLGK